MLLASIDIELTLQKMVLDSSLKNIRAVEELVLNVQKEYSLRDDSCDDIWVVLNEAVSNAIKHGNRFDPDKKVFLSIETRYGRYICFTVKDEGEGFDPASVPDPTSPERICEPNGRGVFLINKLADKAIYSNKGTVVEMWFDLFKN